MRSRFGALTALVLAVLVVLGGGAASAADRTLLFGVNTALSGGAAPTGRGLLRALELTVDEVNGAGGIKVGGDRYLVKLVVYDNKYDSREAVSIANKLLVELYRGELPAGY